jgi:hypothetical protein
MGFRELGLQGGHVTPDTIICIVLFTCMTRVNASTAVRRRYSSEQIESTGLS